jgi:DNA-binding MarR family transcriptional regulator
MKRGQQKLATIGLSVGAASFIRAIGDHDDMTLSDVAKLLRVETPTLSSLAVRMERDGLLERVPSPHDKRALLLRLTPRARELGQHAETITQIELADLTHGLSDPEQAQLVSLLDRILQNIDK